MCVSVLLLAVLVASAAANPIGSLLGNGDPPSGAKKLLNTIGRFERTFQSVGDELDDIETRKVNRTSFDALTREVKDFKAEFKLLENELRVLENETEEIRQRLGNTIVQAAPILPPCAGTKLRETGYTVAGKLATVPNGVVCIGNSQNPSPKLNFLVFRKLGASLDFIGTQSKNKDFIDYTPYVNWTIPAQNVCTSFTGSTGCSALPAHLRGVIANGASGMCSYYSPSGTVYLLCSNSYDSLVDNDGAITVLSTASETLWY